MHKLYNLHFYTKISKISNISLLRTKKGFYFFFIYFVIINSVVYVLI